MECASSKAADASQRADGKYHNKYEGDRASPESDASAQNVDKNVCAEVPCGVVQDLRLLTADFAKNQKGVVAKVNDCLKTFPTICKIIVEGADSGAANASQILDKIRNLETSLTNAKESLQARKPEDLSMDQLKATWKALQDTENEMKLAYNDLPAATEHPFFFVSAAHIKCWKGGPLPCHQDLEQALGGGCFKKISIGFNHVALKAKLLEQLLVVSHRWWEKEHADTEGKQLKVLGEYLGSHPEIEWVWMDWWSLPQNRPSAKRSDSEEEFFRVSLAKVNLLFLGLPVLIIADLAYIGRFWTSYETFLSTRTVTPTGLNATETSALRCKILAMGSAEGSQDSVANAILKTWSTCSVGDAHQKLSAADIKVTNMRDKEQQLDVLQSFERTIPALFRLLELAESPAQGPARAEDQMGVVRATQQTLALNTTDLSTSFKQNQERIAKHHAEILAKADATLETISQTRTSIEESVDHGVANTSQLLDKMRELEQKLDQAKDQMQPGIPENAAVDVLKAALETLQGTRIAMQSVHKKLASGPEHSFFFVSAERIKQWTGGPLPRHQELEEVLGKGCFKKFTISFKDIALREPWLEQLLIVSHRWWDEDHADKDGQQTQVLSKYLGCHSNIEWVWMDWWCLPQSLPEKARDDHENDWFEKSLDKIYMLFVGLKVLIIADFTFIGRFWTSYETFLSTRTLTQNGLEVSQNKDLRCDILAMGSAQDSLQELREIVLTTWAESSVSEAHRKLAENDIYVKEPRDKKQQLRVLLQLERTIPALFKLIDLPAAQVVNEIVQEGFTEALAMEAVQQCGIEGGAAMKQAAKLKQAAAADSDRWFKLGSQGGGTVDGTAYTKKQCYENAIKHRLDHATAWFNLGVIGGGTVDGKAYTKTQCYEAAIKHSPDHTNAWYNLGVIGGGTVDGTTYTETQCYEAAIKSRPDFTNAWHNLGARGGGTVDGTTYTNKQCYETAIKHRPDYANAWYGLGVAGGGTVDGTTYTRKQCHETAIKHSPDHANAWEALGNAGGGTVDGRAYTKKQCYTMTKRIKSPPRCSCLLM